MNYIQSKPSFLNISGFNGAVGFPTVFLFLKYIDGSFAFVVFYLLVNSNIDCFFQYVLHSFKCSNLSMIIYVCMYVCVCICMYVYAYVYMYVCMYDLYMYIYYIYMYIHTHT